MIINSVLIFRVKHHKKQRLVNWSCTVEAPAHCFCKAHVIVWHLLVLSLCIVRVRGLSFSPHFVMLARASLGQGRASSICRGEGLKTVFEPAYKNATTLKRTILRVNIIPFRRNVGFTAGHVCFWRLEKRCWPVGVFVQWPRCAVQLRTVITCSENICVFCVVFLWRMC